MLDEDGGWALPRLCDAARPSPRIHPASGPLAHPPCDRLCTRVAMDAGLRPAFIGRPPYSLPRLSAVLPNPMA